MLSIQPLALPGAKSCQRWLPTYQRPGTAVLQARARKQTEKRSNGADLASDVLPADLEKLSKLAKAELQRQLEVRGLDKDGNKDELATRLLDNLIAQESAVSTNPPDRVTLEQQLQQPAAAATTPARRGRRTSRKATASADPQPEIPGSPKASDPVVAAAATAAVVAEPVEQQTTSRRGRKTSRKATTSADPLPSPADIVAAASAAAMTESASPAEVKPTGRGGKASRNATASADSLPSPADIPAAAITAAPVEDAAPAEAKASRRGRKTSRKATSSADPVDVSTSLNAAVATAEVAAPAATESPEGGVAAAAAGKCGRRSKTTAVEPTPAAGEDSSMTEAAAGPVKAGRVRRASRKSSVVEPEPSADDIPAAPMASAEGAGSSRTRGRRSTAKTSSTAATAAEDPVTPAVPAAAGVTSSGATTPAAAAAPAVSRAKLLAQQLARKEVATHGMGAAVAAAAAAAAGGAVAGSSSAPPAADAAVAGAPGSTWVASDELLYAGSQAQSDSLLMGTGDYSMQAQSTFSVDNGSVDEVIAQLTAERSAGLADEPQLRPEATLNSTTTSSSSAVQQPQAGPGIADIAAAADAPPQQYMQSLVEAPAAAEPAVAPADDALSAFDAMMLPPSAGAADAAASWAAPAAPAAAASTQEDADLQHPTMADCVAAVEEPLMAAAEAVEEDEAPDSVLSAFDHMAVDAPPAPAAQEAAAGTDVQHPTIADCVAAVEEPLAATAEAVEEDEAPDSALSAFDHMAVDTPPAPAAAVGTDGQHPTMADCVAAVEELLAATADAVEEDEAPDAAMAAFDHTPLDSPVAAAVADGNQSPSLADIVLAVEPSSLPPSLEGSLGEDEEPDMALAAFDHMTPEAPRSEAATVAAPAAAAAAVVADETVGYDQAYLDPLQPSALGASVGSGSMDMADAAEPEPVVAAAVAAAAPAPAVSAVPAAAAVGPKEQQQQQRGSGEDPADFGAMMQRWWSSVVMMFEEWQKNLGGPK